MILTSATHIYSLLIINSNKTHNNQVHVGLHIKLIGDKPILSYIDWLIIKKKRKKDWTFNTPK
jgi:hypothetical protein